MYSSVADMIARFGEVELTRLTTPSGAVMSAVDETRVTRALIDASALIDSYLRRRYATPVIADLPELDRAAAVLARFDLAHGDEREPSSQMQTQREEVMSWLKSIRDGTVLLDLAEAPSSDESHATMQDRGGDYGSGASAFGYFGGGSWEA